VRRVVQNLLELRLSMCSPEDMTKNELLGRRSGDRERLARVMDLLSC
jgi:hypothetical protein